MSELFERNFEIKVTLTGLKTGEQLDYFIDYEGREDYARAYFSHLQYAHKFFDYPFN